MQKYNVYSRLKRVNLDDLDGMEVSELVPLIIELNILVQDLGKRLKSYGDNKLDELDEACGNAEARKIFTFIDEFMNHDGNEFTDDYYKNKLRLRLTDFMFKALEETKKIAKDGASTDKLDIALAELVDAEQELESVNFAKNKTVEELTRAASENEKLKSAIKICGKTCLCMIGVQGILNKGDKKA